MILHLPPALQAAARAPAAFHKSARRMPPTIWSAAVLAPARTQTAGHSLEAHAKTPNKARHSPPVPLGTGSPHPLMRRYRLIAPSLRRARRRASAADHRPGARHLSPPGRAPRPGPAPQAGRNEKYITHHAPLPLRCRGHFQVPGGLVLSIPADGRVNRAQRSPPIAKGRAARLWLQPDIARRRPAHQKFAGHIQKSWA